MLLLMTRYLQGQSSLLRWLPVLLWMSTIFLISHQPKSSLEPAQPSALFDVTNLVWGSLLDLSWDTIAGKTAHVLVFGMLAALLWWACASKHLAFWGSAVYAVTNEVHQLFVPGRTPRLTDVVFYVLGALLVILWLQARECGVDGRAKPLGSR